MNEIEVIRDAGTARIALEPIRLRLLAELATPESATTLEPLLGIPRQKINYHLRTLEEHGLIQLVSERRVRNTTERFLQASSSYVISPDVFEQVQPDPRHSRDHRSLGWLLAVTAQLMRDLGELLIGSRRAGRKVATFALDGEIRFASAAARTQFATELSAAVTALAAKYHDENAPGGRPHRMVVAVHPSVRPARRRTLPSD
ncbi:helix-turn-helix domain-containing protein [Lentzea flaviverrucosa]|uniref:Helix-turn-helix domain-containing protein n=1 Tax=Lentzea flaviverrucosa TaxID=200379 RepID=A0A1H9HK49_9PSEU|nr:helix-turn-helix domain-containing protein [Lentzea flaviverrucosa]RDI34563.1 helix-turn-helix protein [Lentzea flaviverrucosa]SEQ62688.1 Helix-turn-helix domain-containing protein [Lentzea flaviverrucosa]